MSLRRALLTALAGAAGALALGSSAVAAPIDAPAASAACAAFFGVP
jgi:hypothetical protein